MGRLFSLLALIAVTGCGGGAGDRIPVAGTLKFSDGASVVSEGGSLVFQPVGDGKPGFGEVDPNGNFSVKSRTGEVGIAPGTYKVVVQLWKNYRNQELAVPKAYGDPATTPLEATVDADHDQFDFVIEK
jgi:hypothetical protein